MALPLCLRDQRTAIWCFVATLAMVAIVLYGLQFTMEGFQLASEEEVTCAIKTATTVSSLCYDQDCGGRECFTTSRECFKLTYVVTFVTPNGLSVLAVTEKTGEWPTYAEAVAAGEAAAGTDTTCYYTPGDAEFIVDLQPTAMESSWIPVALFVVVFWGAAACSLCWARRAAQEEDDDEDNYV